MSKGKSLLDQAIDEVQNDADKDGLAADVGVIAKKGRKPKDRTPEAGWTVVKMDNVPEATGPRQNLAVDLMKKELTGEILDYSFKWSTMYAALKVNDAVTGVVVLLKYFDDEVQYKVIKEEDGPNYFDCPKRIVKLLTPATNDLAKAWRETIIGDTTPKVKKEKKEKVEVEVESTDVPKEIGVIVDESGTEDLTL
jgi:hypothetical protein